MVSHLQFVWNHYKHIRKVAAVVLLVVSLAGASSAEDLGIVSATVKVELPCPSCASGLERRLNRLDSVGAVEIRATEGQVVLTPAPESRLDLHAVWDVIRNAGFQPTGIALTAVGRVTESHGAPALELSEDVVLPVAAGERAESLVEAAGGRVARVTGQISAPPSDGAGAEQLRVEAFEIP